MSVGQLFGNLLVKIFVLSIAILTRRAAAKAFAAVALSTMVSFSSSLGFAEGISDAPKFPDAAQVEKSALEDASMHKYGDLETTCLRWTDRCRHCTRENGPLVCSNIGIHCQPGKIECVARRPVKKHH
jgi:hypothetical protein